MTSIGVHKNTIVLNGKAYTWLLFKVTEIQSFDADFKKSTDFTSKIKLFHQRKYFFPFFHLMILSYINSYSLFIFTTSLNKRHFKNHGKVGDFDLNELMNKFLAEYETGNGNNNKNSEYEEHSQVKNYK